MDPERRVRVATRSLVRTRVVLEKNCHDVIRLFRNNPLAMNVVLARHSFSIILSSRSMSVCL